MMSGLNSLCHTFINQLLLVHLRFFDRVDLLEL